MNSIQSLISYLLFRGNTQETKGTAFVVFEDIFDAKNACDHLSGFNVCNRYLVVLYYQTNRVFIQMIVTFDEFCHSFGFYLILKAFKRLDADKKMEEMEDIKKKYNVT